MTGTAPCLTVVEELSERRHDLLGAFDQLAPGDADNAPARLGKLEIALAVTLECLRRVVGSTTIRLHDDAMVRPAEVYLISRDPNIQDRLRQARVAHKFENPALQFAANARRLACELGEATTQDTRTPPAVRPFQGRHHCPMVVETKHHRLFDRTIEHSGCHDGCQVEESS
jgi:hypothetical protein